MLRLPRGSSPGNALQEEYRASGKRRGWGVWVFIWEMLKLGRRCLAMGKMRFQAGRMERGVGSWWKQEDERDRNDSCCSLQRRMCRCSAKCDSLSNQLHPLLLFLLATALWHLYKDILDAAIQIQKCAAGQQMQYKVFSCVLHLQQACARDITQPARSLSIPDSSGSCLRSPDTVRLLFILNSTSWQARAYTFIYNRISGQLIWDSQWLIPVLRQEEQAGHFSILFHLACFFFFHLLKFYNFMIPKLFNLKENSLCNCRLSGSSTRDSSFEELLEQTQICSKSNYIFLKKFAASNRFCYVLQ